MTDANPRPPAARGFEDTTAHREMQAALDRPPAAATAGEYGEPWSGKASEPHSPPPAEGEVSHVLGCECDECQEYRHWEVFRLFDAKGEPITTVEGPPGSDAIRLGKRALDCVNACAGLADPERDVADLVAALREIEGMAGPYFAGGKTAGDIARAALARHAPGREGEAVQKFDAFLDKLGQKLIDKRKDGDAQPGREAKP